MSEVQLEPGAAAEPAISDDEIRDWARSTGRAAGGRGRVSAALRSEYEAIARGLGGEPPAEDPVDATTAPPPAQPAAARAEARPRAVRRKRPRSRIAAFLSGDSGASSSRAKGKGKAAADRPRVSLDKFAGKIWGRVAQGFEHVNVPVARCMAWQSPYVGIMAEETLRNTVLDRVLQPIARTEEKFTTAAAVIAMPFIVAALQNPGNQPAAGLGGVARYQLLAAALEECVEAQLEAFGSGEMAARVVKSQAERDALRKQVDNVVAMIWFDVPDPKTPAEAEQAEADEQLRRRSVFIVQPDPVVPEGRIVIGGTVAQVVDDRGQAAEKAAAAMGASGQAAAEQQRAAVAGVVLGPGARF